jgi:hypothetical protein
MDLLAIVIAIPLGAVLLSGLVLHFVDTPWVRRISTTAIGAQLALTGLAWALLDTLPRETDWSGSVGATCPRMEGVQGGAVAVVAFGSIAVAAVALAAGAIVVRRRAGSAWRIAGGVLAIVLMVAIFAGILGSALCGMN